MSRRISVGGLAAQSVRRNPPQVSMDARLKNRIGITTIWSLCHLVTQPTCTISFPSNRDCPKLRHGSRESSLLVLEGIDSV